MTRKSRMSRIGALVVLFVGWLSPAQQSLGAFAHTDKTAAPVAKEVEDRAVNSFHRQQVANRDGESVQAACKMPAVQGSGRLLRLQLGERRQQQTQADLQPDLPARRRDRDQRRLAHRLNGIIGQACGSRHPRRLLRTIGHCTLRRKGEHRSTQVGQQLAQEIVNRLGGKGNVIMVTGVAGTFADAERNKGAGRGLQEEPWDESRRPLHGHVGLPRPHSATPQHSCRLCRRSTASGSGWLGRGPKAFIDAKRTPLPPTAGEAENGFRKFMLPQGYLGQHVTGISIGQPPFLVLASLELAREVLLKQRGEGRHRDPVPGGDRKDREARQDRLPESCRQFLHGLHGLRSECHRRDLCPGRPERKGLPGHLESESAEVSNPRSATAGRPAAAPRLRRGTS